MTRVEISKSPSMIDTINIYGVKYCPIDCPFRNSNGRFKCERYNGNSVIRVSGGMTRATQAEFSAQAPCVSHRG